jgi:hypothetical protein
MSPTSQMILVSLAESQAGKGRLTGTTVPAWTGTVPPPLTGTMIPVLTGTSHPVP